MRSFIDVTLHVTMSLEESLEIERILSGNDSPTVRALAEALRVQNAIANRLAITGAIARPA